MGYAYTVKDQGAVHFVTFWNSQQKVEKTTLTPTTLTDSLPASNKKMTTTSATIMMPQGRE